MKPSQIAMKLKQLKPAAASPGSHTKAKKCVPEGVAIL